MRNILFPMSAVLALGAGAAFAQDTGFQGAEINLEYNSSNNENLGLSTTISTWSSNFAAAYNIAPQFGVQVGAGYNNLGVDEKVGSDTWESSLDLTDLNAHAYYNYGAESKFGVFVGSSSFGNYSEKENGVLIEEVAIPTKLLTYGVEGMYNSGPVKIEARYGIAEVREDGVLISDLDISLYGLDAEYAVSPKFNLVGGVEGAKVAMFGEELTLNAYSVGVEYMLMERFAVTAGVSGGSLSTSLSTESIDTFGYSVGAEYVLSGTTLFASYGKTTTSAGGIDVDTTNLKVGANIAFGRPSSSELFNNSGFANTFNSLESL